MRAAKVDENQKEIVAALRKAGVFVQSLASVGQGVPDLLCGFRNRWVLLEVKDGKKVQSAQKLTPEQKLWHEAARRCAPVHVVNSIDQAIWAVFDQQGAA